jgi:hypothetical protein
MGIRLTKTDQFGSSSFTKIRLSEKQGSIGSSKNLEPSKFNFGSVPIITEKPEYTSAPRKTKEKRGKRGGKRGKWMWWGALLSTP